MIVGCDVKDYSEIGYCGIKVCLVLKEVFKSLSKMCSNCVASTIQKYFMHLFYSVSCEKHASSKRANVHVLLKLS